MYASKLFEVIKSHLPDAHAYVKMQPRPQGLLAFQYGGGSGEDPGTQQITCLQRGWRCIQNGGYGEKGEKNWVRDAKVKINKWRNKQTRFGCKSLRNTAKC